jgi:hypothetical protein
MGVRYGVRYVEHWVVEGEPECLLCFFVFF